MPPLPFHLMAKPRGPICNLACRHCYYLPKQQLFPAADCRMSDAVLVQYVRQYLDAHPGGEVTFAWQGGEPTLMGLPFYERAVALQREHARPRMRVTNTIQTNGLVLDADWCQFFAAHEFLVGVSVDGPNGCHDTLRRSPAGEGTLERVVRAVRLLQEHGVEHNLLTCVHRANAERPLDVYRFLRDELGARYVQLIPVVAGTREPRARSIEEVGPDSVEPHAYGRFLVAVFDEWSRRDVGRVFVQEFDAALAGWVGAQPGVCIHQESCGRALVLEHNGELYSCDHFVEPSHRLGNILETPLAALVESAAQRQFGRDKRDRLPTECRRCHFLRACRGGCPKDRLVPGDELGRLRSYLCEGYRLFYQHAEPAMQFMAAEISAGRAPSNLMAHLAFDRATGSPASGRPGRNDPCPCGSGRKYKRCHGAR